MKEKKLIFLIIKTKEYFLTIAIAYSYRWKYVFRPKKETWEEI
jgi:hypothetical protein